MPRHSALVCRATLVAAAGCLLISAGPVLAQSLDTSRVSTSRKEVPAVTPAISRPGGAAPRGAPANDNCTAPTLVLEGTFAFSTIGATNDGAATCGISTLSPDVWFSYTPAASGAGLVETCNLAAFDTVLSAHSACGGSEFACNDDTCALQSHIEFPVTAGVTYVIRVAGFNGAVGSGSIAISHRAPCPFVHPDSATPEPEPCGQDTNGGCNQPDGQRPEYTDITCDTTIAGLAWASTGSRDTDWYRVSVAPGTPVSIALQSAFPAVLFAFDEACPPTVTQFTDSTCSRDGILEFVAGGPTVVFVSTGSLGGALFDGLPCGPASTNGYTLSMLFGRPCSSFCPCDWNHSGEVNSQDFFDFIVAFFSGSADFNGNGTTDSQDFFDFLLCFFNGCPPTCNFPGIRSAVSHPEEDPPIIQANYDALDRSLFLFGDVPFGQLFMSRVSELLPILEANLSRTPECTGQTFNRARILLALRRLSDVSGRLSIGDLVALGPGESPESEEALDEIRALHVVISGAAATQDAALQRREAIAILVTEAPAYTINGLFFQDYDAITPPQDLAIRFAINSGILAHEKVVNNRTCRGCPGLPSLKVCPTNTGSACYLKPGGDCSTCNYFSD